MFKSYLNCKYTIFNESYEEKLKLKRTEDTESDKLRLAKGNQFENDYLKELQKKYSKVIDLKKGDKKTSKEEIAKETIKCMKEGYEVIRGGYCSSSCPPDKAESSPALPLVQPKRSPRC